MLVTTHFRLLNHYILNVVVKQEILIKTQENKTGDVLSCYMLVQSSIHYKKNLLIHNSDSLKISF